MKTLTIELPDDVYERAQQRAAEMGTSLDQEVAELVARIGNGLDGARLTAARARMQELFRTVKGFRMTPKIPREELYDR